MKIKLYYSVLLAMLILSGCAADNGLVYSHDRARSYATSGFSHYAEGNYELAISDFNKAIKINPKISVFYLHRAEIYQQQKEYDLALADYAKAIELNPELHVAYWHKAKIYQQQKEYDLALADFNKAIDLNPSPDYYRGRGSVYYRKKQYDSAVKEYIKAIKLNSHFAQAYNDLAWLLATCSEEKYRNGLKAVEFAKKAVEFSKMTVGPGDPKSQMFDTLAAAYAETGDFDMAVKTQEKAILLLKEESNSDNLNVYEKRLESYKRDIPWTEII